MGTIESRIGVNLAGRMKQNLQRNEFAPDHSAEGRGAGRRLAMMALCALWIFALGFAFISFAVVMPDIAFSSYVKWELAGAVAGLGLSVALYFVLERLHPLSKWYAIGLVSGLSIGASIAHNALLDALAFPLLGIPPNSDIQAYFDFNYWAHFYLAWCVISMAILFSEQAKAEERVRIEAETLSHLARMLALRYQLHPHFLFNALNSVATLVLDRRYSAAENMVQRLSSYLQRGLSDPPLDEIPLAEELEHQLDYLAIEKERFAERLNVEMRVSDEARSALVPGYILQPLLENAIKHGVARTPKPVTVLVSAKVEDATLQLSVHENSDSNASTASSGGIGLANVRSRLLELYGEEASLRTRSEIGAGFESVISLPLRRSRAKRRERQ